MSKNQFLQYKQFVKQILREYRVVREKNKVKDKGLSISVEHKANPFIKGNFTIAVVGKMSAGKSTFINAFLGNKNLLPTGHFQTTCVLTKIEYSEKESIEIIYGDDHKETINGNISGKLKTLVAIEDKYDSLPVNAVNKLIIKGWSKSRICESKMIEGLEELAGNKIEKKILEQYIDSHPKSQIAKEVTIKYPMHKDCEGWRIVDTPGVEAVGGIDIETTNFLTSKDENGHRNVDAIIFLHKGTDNIQGKSFKEFVKNIFNSLSEDAKKRIFFVVTNAADTTFQNNEMEYMRKAKALFVEPYGIKEDRLISVDSLMEIFDNYIDSEQKDVAPLLRRPEAPDSSWDNQTWKLCRGLLRDIRDTLDDAGKNINNENMLAMVKNWSNFDKLREILNDFVKNEKKNAYNDLMQTIRKDINQCIDYRKNDIALLQEGEQKMQGQMNKLEEIKLEINEAFGTIQRKYCKEAVAERFGFIEQRIKNKINIDSATFDDIRRETIELYDIVDEKKKEIFLQISKDFEKYIQASTHDVFFIKPDFEAIDKKAEDKATKPDTRTIPGLCCDGHEEYKKVDEDQKLKEFKTMSVWHIRQESYKFKKEIQEIVDEYIEQVYKSLYSAIAKQYEHIEKIKDEYNELSLEKMQEKIKVKNEEIEAFNKFLNAIAHY